MAPLQHRVRRVAAKSHSGGRKIKTVHKTGDEPVIQKDMSVQALRDLKVVQGEKSIIFDSKAVNDFEELYGVRLSKDTLTSLLAGASIQNADDILILHERVVDLESRVIKQEKQFRVPTIVNAPILPDEFVQMTSVAEVLDQKH